MVTAGFGVQNHGRREGLSRKSLLAFADATGVPTRAAERTFADVLAATQPIPDELEAGPLPFAEQIITPWVRSLRNRQRKALWTGRARSRCDFTAFTRESHLFWSGQATEKSGIDVPNESPRARPPTSAVAHKRTLSIRQVKPGFGCCQHRRDELTGSLGVDNPILIRFPMSTDRTADASANPPEET